MIDPIPTTEMATPSSNRIRALRTAATAATLASVLIVAVYTTSGAIDVHPSGAIAGTQEVGSDGPTDPTGATVATGFAAQLGPQGEPGPPGTPGAQGPSGSNGIDGPAGLVTDPPVSYTTPVAAANGQTPAYLVATRSVTVPNSGGALIVWTTTTVEAEHTGTAKRHVEGRLWIEIGGDGSCASFSATNSASFWKRSENRHLSVGDLRAVAAASVGESTARVDICTDADTDRNVSWTLTGNTIIQWVGGWLG